MAKTLIGFNRKTAKIIVDGLAIKDPRKYFGILGLKVDQTTQLTFRMLGGRPGKPAWKGYSPFTLHPSWLKGGIRIIGTGWNIRYGTDKEGRPGMQGKKRTGIRRFSENSKMLQASGGFRRSFKILKFTGNEMLYGLSGNMKQLGKDIMSRREVLFVTRADRKQWGQLFIGFYKRGLKF